MPKLIDQIRDQAVESHVPIGDVLRRCKVLAVRIGDSDLEAWVDLELNGYPPDAVLPSYRVIEHPFAVGCFSGVAGSKAMNMPISSAALPVDFQEFMHSWKMHKPAATFEDTLKNATEGYVVSQWPAEVLGYVDQFEMSCVKAWFQIPTQQIVVMLETVRNKILNYVLEIEKRNPDAGEAVAPKIPREILHQAFINNIGGNVGNLAQSSPNSSQTATIEVRTGDFASLERALKAQGVPELDLVELKRVVEVEPPSPERKTFGPKVAAWIGKTLTRVGTGAAAGVIVKAIATFCGF